MNFKKVFLIFVLIILVTNLSFIVQASKPEIVIEDFWQVFTEGQLKEAEDYIEDTEGIKKIAESIWGYDSKKEEFNDLALTYLKKVKIEVVAYNIVEDIAYVDIVLESPDFDILQQKVLQAAFPQVFSALFTGASQQEIEKIIEEIFLKQLDKTEIINIEYTVELLKVEETWKIKSEPMLKLLEHIDANIKL